jgi:sec-independent protein translocase protein TatA
MGSFSLWHWIVVAVIVLLLFGGRGKISSLMGDFAQGIKAFMTGMAAPAPKADAPKEPMKTIDSSATTTSAANAENRKAV